MMIAAALVLGLAAAPTAAAASTGGIVAGSPARITGVSCVKSCVSSDEAQAGSIVRVRGRNLQDTARVVFLGRTGGSDDVSAGVRRRDAKSTTVDVRVPSTARSGPVLLLDRDGSASQHSSTGITIDHGVDPRGAGSITGRGIVAKLESRTVYYGGKRGQRLAYSLTGPQATPVRVDLVRVADGSVVQTWGPASVPPGSTQTIEWKGGPKVGDSRFQFQIFTGSAATSPTAPPNAIAGARTAAGSGAPSVAGSFLYLQHIFPIRGRHNYGDAQNRYGAPRAGHRHAGQDVLAACGTPLVAARGGKVLSAGYGGDAGNYVAIHGSGGDYDMFYAHLRSTPLVREGQRVYTGQLIGYVGETGDATVCHLHFELWVGGWWNGGHTIDPLPTLKAWDALS
jgi:murein DD-endopeptidase MepM/ murein hydrolase activator NlpD